MIVMDRRRLIVLVIAATVVLGGGIYLWLLLTTSTISISTSTNATIFVRQGEQDFQEIGRGQATYKTRSSDTVFAEARENDAASQKAVKPIKRQTIQVELAITPLPEAKLVAPGPLAYPHIESGFIYGINPHTSSLSVRPIGGDVNALVPSTPNLPFLKQVVWRNSQNYIYVTQGKGAGVIINGQSFREEGAEGEHEHEEADQEAFPYTAVAASPDLQNIAALSFDGLFLTKQFNLTGATKIATPPTNARPNLFADASNFYLTALVYEESGGEGHGESDPKETRLTVFGHDGKQKHEFTLPFIENLYKVAALDQNNLVVLAPNGMLVIDVSSGKFRQQDFSFGEVKDLLVHKDKVLLLGGAGLWEYDPANNEYHKVARYPEGEEYAANSLAVVGDVIYFSTSITDQALRQADTKARSSVYQLSLP